MEMVSAARLRRAEQRIAELRPYARGIRMMTRRAVDAAEHIPNMPLLEDREKAHFMRIEEHEWQLCREQLTAGYEGKASA